MYKVFKELLPAIHYVIHTASDHEPGDSKASRIHTLILVFIISCIVMVHIRILCCFA